MAGEQKKNNAPLKLVSYNELTERLSVAIKEAQQEHHSVAVIMISLHQLKTINSEFGHKSGDELIESVGAKLINMPIKYNAISHFHGTNYILVIDGIQNKADVEKIVTKIVHVLLQPVMVGQQQHIPSITAGISLYPENAAEAQDLVDKAFKAAHRAHLGGSQNIVFYAQELSGGSQINRILENDLLLALRNDEFRLLFQPQVDAKTGKIEGVEALVRWFNFRLGEISPVFFIPIAEASGLINPLGEWVIDRSCARISKWRSQGIVGDDFFISINVSPVQLENNQLCDFVLNIMSRYQIPNNMVQIELTETALMQNVKSSVKQLTRMRERGIKIAVDDFGTGYSSLTHLSKLPVDIVKLDRSFISSINESTTQMVVKSVIDLAHQLGLQVTAEGVETEQQLKILSEFNCDLIQGYYFSMPVSEDKIILKLNPRERGKK